MKRTKKEYELELDPFACYKMEIMHEEAKADFESVDKWLYLGANARDPGFAKVGITMQNLATRSSSSESPGYHLFCAFKCKSNISKVELERIEQGALKYLESAFLYEDGSSKRASHFESDRLSECFYDIDFLDFFGALHYYLFENHSRYFSISAFYSDEDFYEGDFLDCEFNAHYMLRDEINRHIRRILQ